MLRVLNTLKLEGCPQAIEAFAGIATVETVNADYGAVLERIGEADAYLAALSVKVDRGLLERAGRLKVIGSPATGTDHLDLPAIRAAGITCFDIARELELLRGFTATSELAFALILMLNRRLLEATAAARGGDWARERFTGFQLSGKVLGILGMGRLGRITARIGAGFGMRILAHDIRPDGEPGTQWTDLETLCRQADVLSVHVHLTEATRGLVGERELSLMKPTALLINTSRGGIVDEAALLRALQSGRIAGAGLDVIDGEWRTDLDAHPLIRHARDASNLVITPHIGGATVESIYGARIFMARKVAEFLRTVAPQR
jgi:D-3-phosphoglycerate dehydrogenase / 2-oxoglutarate reductase